MPESLVKRAVLWSISQGLRLPQPPIDRVSELVFLKDLLTQLRVDCVLDVGANRGQFASELRAIGYAGWILSFEPIATEFRVMQERFKGDAAWRGFPVALGSRDESKTMTVPGLTVMSSLLESVVTEPNARTETVQIRRLDAYLPSILPPGGVSRFFLKMDTQGYDLEVFRGAEGVLDRIHGLQSELSIQPLYKQMPHYLEALQCYEGADFELFNLSVVNRIETGGLLELNCFMRRGKRPAA